MTETISEPKEPLAPYGISAANKTPEVLALNGGIGARLTAEKLAALTRGEEVVEAAIVASGSTEGVAG